MNWKIMLPALLLLALVTGAAAFTTTTHTRCSAGTAMAASVTGLKATYSGACANYSWTAVSDADFNRFVVQTTSSATALNGKDFNTTGNSWSFCTLPPGTWINTVVYRIDGNADGYCLNVQPDANVTLNPGSESQAAKYLVFEIFVGFATTVVLIIMAIVAAILLAKFGIKAFRK